MTALKRFFRRHLTPGGRVAIGALLVGAPSLLNPDQTQLDVLLGFAFCLLLTSFVTALVFRRKLASSWELPSRATCGSAITLAAKIHNRSRRSSYQLEAILDELPEGIEILDSAKAYKSQIESDESTQLKLVLKTSKRGDYNIGPLFIGSSFPFGILRLGRFVGARWRLLVTPRIHPVHHMSIEPGTHRQRGLDSVSRQKGETTDFIGVREYRQGDSLRKVHWKLLARRGVPVVREFADESYTRVGIILDTYRATTPEHFERVTEIVASIANYLSQEKASIDFFAESSKVHTLADIQGQDSKNFIFEALARAKPCLEPPYKKLLAQAEHFSTTLSAIIFVTYQLSEERASFQEQLRATGIPIKTYSLTEDEGDSDAICLKPSQLPGCLQVL